MSNYTSTIKITKNYQTDPHYDTNGTSRSPTNANATKIYLKPDERTYFGSPAQTVTNGRSSPEKGRTSPVKSTHNTKKNSDFKEDYDPDYRRNENIYWRDPEKEAKLKKDYYINHKKISEEEYNKYLDKENLREKSLLRRISAEDEIRDKARQYYEQNTAKKPARSSVSEIFSKRTLERPKKDKSNVDAPKTDEPKTSIFKNDSFKNSTFKNDAYKSDAFTNDTYTKPSGTRPVSIDSTTPSILKGNDYAPVYKTRSASYRSGVSNIDHKINEEPPKKQEVYFSDIPTEKYDYGTYNTKTFETAPKTKPIVIETKKTYESTSTTRKNLIPQPARKISEYFDVQDDDVFKDCAADDQVFVPKNERKYSDYDFRTPISSSPVTGNFDFGENARRSIGENRSFVARFDERRDSGDEKKDARCSDLLNMYYENVEVAPTRMTWNVNKKV